MRCDELRERYCTMVNASGDADLDISKMAVGEDRISLSYSFTINRERTIRSDKPDSFEVYRINRLKEIFGHDGFSIDIHSCHYWFWHDILDFRCW